MTTVVEGDTVTVSDGDSTVIIHKGDHAVIEKAASSSKVRDAVQAIFKAVEKDAEVKEFGIGSRKETLLPDVLVPRTEFTKLVRPAEPELKPTKRSVTERSTQVVVLKVWLERGDHKWSFTWKDGIKVSATIKDDELWDQIEDRAIILGSGDVLVVDLEVEQERSGNVWVNTGYAIVKFHSHKQAAIQRKLPK